MIEILRHPKFAEIEILHHPNGRPWTLGAGGFGQVFKALRNGVQPVAVKVLSTVGWGY